MSVLVDLDPAAAPTPAARDAAITSAVDSARREVEARDASHAERVRLRETVDALEALLVPTGAPVRGARSLAAFGPLDEGRGDVDVLRLPEPVAQAVAVDPQPLVEPLVGLAADDRWCVVLVDRTSARIYLGDRHALEQTNAFDDDVHRRHDQGGWSQANYQRSIEADVHHHLVRVAVALQQALLRNGLYDHLLIGAAQPLRSAVEEHLHPEIRKRLVGWLDIDISSARDADVREAAGAAMAEHEAGRTVAALDRLQAAVGRPEGAGAHGWRDVLRALSERRVRELLVCAGERPRGARCPTCGLLAVAEDLDGRCPADGTPLTEVADVAQAAIAAAYFQDADVLVLRDEPRLQTLGCVGAVQRF